MILHIGALLVNLCVGEWCVSFSEDRGVANVVNWEVLRQVTDY